ncbi:Beta-carotene hydroxylase [Candidatus Phaeomarinobacter ectocarpi]|uniref:Beta-carotene hydroxylase n=1 Tax=Candidatus Phaeomarinibacter ectocarpi TaxID=1458461 RepID=X5MLR1_9HYPH|nr:fatty acid desaturase [Candidatus Phaeomarinobacter ectocarpi]CDO59695.1 Beta-carotene hydroxylase [Candidatus Phaeomarinobacter ectocarpi]
MLPELKPHSDAMATTAHAMIGGVVWQTIALSLGAAAVIITVMTLGALDLVPLWAVAIVIYVSVYLSYTALHEAVHQNITGGRQDLAWINQAIGTLSAFFLSHSYEMHRTIHLTHHRNTNDPEHDPDHWVKGSNWLMTMLRSLTIFNGYFLFCRRHWDDKRMRRAYWIGLRDTTVSTLVLVAIAVFVDWKLALFGYAIPAMLAAMTLGLLFDYFVHTPHKARARFENTRVFVFPGWLDTLVTWAYVQQNYHGVHHAFPRIPFTKYRAFYRETRTDIQDAGMPVARPLG